MNQNPRAEDVAAIAAGSAVPPDDEVGASEGDPATAPPAHPKPNPPQQDGEPGASEADPETLPPGNPPAR
jgi:hypothetical protein